MIGSECLCDEREVDVLDLGAQNPQLLTLSSNL